MFLSDDDEIDFAIIRFNQRMAELQEMALGVFGNAQRIDGRAEYMLLNGSVEPEIFTIDLEKQDEEGEDVFEYGSYESIKNYLLELGKR